MIKSSLMNKKLLKPVPEKSSEPGQVVRDAATEKREIGGPPGPEPTRYGDWERKGRCIDF